MIGGSVAQAAGLGFGSSVCARGSGGWCVGVDQCWFVPVGLGLMGWGRSGLGPSSGYVGSSWGYVGSSWGYIGPSWSYVWPILGLSWPILKLCWRYVGPSWG